MWLQGPNGKRRGLHVPAVDQWARLNLQLHIRWPLPLLLTPQVGLILWTAIAQPQIPRPTSDMACTPVPLCILPSPPPPARSSFSVLWSLLPAQTKPSHAAILHVSHICRSPVPLSECGTIGCIVLPFVTAVKLPSPAEYPRSMCWVPPPVLSLIHW